MTIKIYKHVPPLLNRLYFNLFADYVAFVKNDVLRIDVYN